MPAAGATNSGAIYQQRLCLLVNSRRVACAAHYLPHGVTVAQQILNLLV